MKHFILFLTGIFLVLFIAVINQPQISNRGESLPVVRVFAYSSFTHAWGAGPRLKEIFERTCQCRVEFIVGADSGILLQRLKIEGANLGVDIVIGLDQFDLQKALSHHTWQKIDFSKIQMEEQIQNQIKNDFFVPYNWGVLSFMVRKDEGISIMELDDLLKPELHRQFALQDPRSSSPGLLFLYWVIQSKGESEGFRFLSKMMEQAHSHSPSWSTAIGLFNKKQVKTVFTYFTSPIYYLIEEKSSNFETVNFKEPHPIQVEFLGIPDFCRQCQLAENFVNLMLSPEGQKILMEKNYMFPVVKGVSDGTPFARAKNFGSTLDISIPSESEVELWLKKWSELRRGGGTF